jgi:site-specific DNA-methyltransferase (adenine-specific)
MLTVQTSLKTSGVVSHGYGVDVDNTLLTIAQLDAALTHADLTLFEQDGLIGLPKTDMDLAIGDLPVGFYPIDEKAARFKVFSKTGHTYMHHLLIEQSMKQVKDGGFGLFLIPTNIFGTDQAKLLTDWLKEEVYIQGIVQLPETLFKADNARKSILILQKHGATANQAQVLAASLTSLTDKATVQRFFREFSDWKNNNHFS